MKKTLILILIIAGLVSWFSPFFKKPNLDILAQEQELGIKNVECEKYRTPDGKYHVDCIAKIGISKCKKAVYLVKERKWNCENKLK